jgi:hypothetical protein
MMLLPRLINACENLVPKCRKPLENHATIRQVYFTALLIAYIVSVLIASTRTVEPCCRTEAKRTGSSRRWRCPLLAEQRAVSTVTVDLVSQQKKKQQ